MPKESQSPRISVLMPNYNYAAFLPRAIEGILSQSYGDFELLVIDDASTDGSWEIIQKYAERDSRIVASRNPKNLGVVRNFNSGIGRLRGEIIYLASSDDYVCHKDFFKDAASAFELHPEAATFFGVSEFFNSETDAAEFKIGQAPHTGYFSGGDFLAEFLQGNIVFFGGTIICRKNEFIKHGGYDYSLRLNALVDYFVDCVMAAHCGTFFSEETYLRVRRNPNSYSSGTSLEEWVQFEKMLRKRLPDLPEKAAHMMTYRRVRMKHMVAGTVRDYCHVSSDAVTEILDAGIGCYMKNLPRGREVAYDATLRILEVLSKRKNLELPLDSFAQIIDHAGWSYFSLIDLPEKSTTVTS